MAKQTRRLFFSIIIIILNLYFTASSSFADSNHAVTNTKDYTGEEIVEEAKKWIGDYMYWSASSPWEESFYRRTGYPYNGTVSFDCSGFVSRVLNDAGFRGDYNPYGGGFILSQQYGNNFIGITIEELVDYGIDITEEVLNAKNGDYLGLRAGDIIGWTNNGRHVIIFAGLVGSTPYMVELWGEYHWGPAHCVYRPVSSDYQNRFEKGARYVPATYKDKCESFPFNSILEVSGSKCWLKTLPVSRDVNPDSDDVVKSALPVGTRMLATRKYLNTEGNYWYRVKLTSGANSGAVGYVTQSQIKEIEHIHNKGTFKFSLDDHPHYKCYECSVCGEVWHDTNEPTERDGCDICFPAITVGAGRTIPDGDYLLALASNPKWFVDISGSELPAANGTNVQLYGPLKDELLESDIWTVTYIDEGGYYKILQKGTNMSLDVYDGSKSNGANIQVYTYYSSANAQKWSIAQNSNGSYRIQAKCSGRSLDLRGADIAAGTNIQQYSSADTLAQQWTFIPYNLVFNFSAEGGDGQMPSIHKSYMDQITIPECSFTKSGYKFKGWAIEREDGRWHGNGVGGWVLPALYTEEVRDNSLYLPGATYNLTDSWVNKGVDSTESFTGHNYTFHAVWELDDERTNYTITFDANGGTGAPSSQVKQEGIPLQIPYEGPDNRDSERLHFVGWSTNQTAEEAEYLLGSTFYIDADTTLYAVWKKYYYVNYMCNGGTNGPMNGTFYESFTVGPGPEYEGYRFMGWSLREAADSVDYQPGDSVYSDHDISLYAVWKSIHASDWMETKSDNVPDRFIQSKTQYRSSTKEMTTSTESSLEGWTQYNSTSGWSEYGPWSEWENTSSYTRSDTMDVEGRMAVGWYYYTCPGCGAHSWCYGNNVCYNCGGSIPDDFHYEYLTTGWEHAQQWRDTSASYAYIDGVLWFKWTDGGSITQQRYRTRSWETTYYYERWTDWSEWSDTPVDESDLRRVETRTVYRYLYPEENILTLPSLLDVIEEDALAGVGADGVIIPAGVTSMESSCIETPFIIGEPGSVAETYARNNGLVFIDIQDYRA